MELHPYDGQDRIFRHTDPDPAPGLAALAKLLRLPAPPIDAHYELHFHSGGIGVLDRLAITIPTAQYPWPTAISALNAETPEAAAANEARSEDFLWLLTLDADDTPLPPRQAAAQFINSNRQPFQPECLAVGHIYFQVDSNVNDWLALWGDDTRINYLAYSQG